MTHESIIHFEGRCVSGDWEYKDGNYYDVVDSATKHVEDTAHTHTILLYRVEHLGMVQ